MTDRFPTIRTEGSILPADLLQRVAASDKSLAGLTPADYHLLEGEKLNEATNRSWNRMLGVWGTFQKAVEKLPTGDIGTSVTRDRWLLPLWQELGYGRLASVAPVVIDDKTYPVSHGWQHAAIHLVGCRADLDSRSKAKNGSSQPSPHSLVQELINRSERHLWAFVTNGFKLRILRDNNRLTRQAYVEFDLQAIFEGKVYADFALLWRLCHQSRVEAEKPHECRLEQWSKAAQEQGLRVLDQLRGGVEKTIAAFGRGFLACPANNTLRDKLRAGNLDAQDYYRQLLRLVYRLLFLFVAEDRELLFDPNVALSLRDRNAEGPTDSANTDDDQPTHDPSRAPGNPLAEREGYGDAARERYTRFYSTSRLRRLAERLRGTQHIDLYQMLSVVMTKLGTTGCPELALPALGGFLFSADALPDLQGCQLANVDLLEAVRALALTSDGHALRPVDYRNLGSEELGSVYESLLELHPVLNAEAATFELSTASGHERKTTGTYYTPTSLITCLLDSALDPVLDEAVKQPDPERALMNLKVCDLACGSGHFLIAAAHRIAKRLAFVRTGEEEPVPEALRHALRDVIGHCIYGVDINPMAVELCKVALWMEALEPGKPLSFLDHHIQCGNSLLGTTPALLAKGIPDDAFTAIEGDVKPRVAELKKQNKREREDYLNRQGYLFDPPMKLGNMAADFARLNSAPDGTLADVSAIQDRYAQLVRGNDYQFGRLLADTWCAAFVWKKDDSADGKLCPTERDFRKVETHAATGLLPHVRAEVERLRDQYQFFHLHLAFPDVFRLPSKDDTPENELTGWNGGFDVMLGNPPWERIKLQEQEWFAASRPEIANAPNAAERRKRIEVLRTTDPVLHAAFLDDRREAEGESHLIRDSSGIDETDKRRGLFPLCGRGDINTYSLFAELNRTVISPTGRVGCIVPSGIATDDTTKVFFQDLMKTHSLASLFSFDNKEGLFVEVKRSFRFCLLTLTGLGRPSANPPEFIFYAGLVEHLDDATRRFALSLDDVALLNPNTRTCPVFRSHRDSELTKTIYRRVPVLLRDVPPPDNPWGVSFFTMLHMAQDSGLFRTVEQLASDGWYREGNIFGQEGRRYLPLYEAKMVDSFDHRAAIYDGDRIHDLTSIEKLDPAMLSMPHYWVPATEVEEQLRNRWDKGWLVGWQDVTDVNTMARTVKFGLIPSVGVAHKFPLIFPAPADVGVLLGLYANLTSFVLDYVARQKLGGTSLTYFYLKQFPVLPPSTYSAPCPWTGPLPTAIAHEQFLLPRVLELTYTAWDLEPFARDCGYTGPPFRWDEERRFLLRAELDAAFFHLYAIHRDDTAYILDTFPIVRRKDEQKYNGEYKTKITILSIYDEMAKSIESGQPYQTRLNPLPADPRVAHPPKVATRKAPASDGIDPLWPSTPRERVLCAAILDLVAAEPNRSDDEYIDALRFLLSPTIAAKLLHDSDLRSWKSAVKQAPPELVQSSEAPHWFQFREGLLGLKALQPAGAGLGIGPRWSEARKGLTPLDAGLISLVTKATQRYREYQDLAGVHRDEAETIRQQVESAVLVNS